MFNLCQVCGIIVLLISWTNAQAPTCRDPLGTELDFTEEPATMALGCNREAIDLYCCMQGFNTITWERKHDGRWSHYGEILDEKWFLDKKQIAHIERPSRDRGDPGYYRCIGISDSGKNITNTILLAVAECNDVGSAAEILVPTEQSSVIEAYQGQSIDQPCVGFCGSSKTQPSCNDVSWIRFYPERTDNVFDFIPRAPNGTNAYFTQKSDRLQGNGLSATLYFPEVRPGDYGMYNCTVFNANGNTYQAAVTLKEIDDPKSVLRKTLISLCILTLAFVLVGVLILRQKEKIMLAYMVKCVQPQDPQGKLHDALILHCDDTEDLDLARSLKEDLEEKYYHVKIPDEVPQNLDRQTGLLDFATESMYLVVVLSPSFVQDRHCLYCLNNFVNPEETSRHAIIFIVENKWEETILKAYEHQDVVADFGGRVAEDEMKDIQRICAAVKLGKRVTRPSDPEITSLYVKCLDQLRLALGNPIVVEQEGEEEANGLMEGQA